MSVNKIKITRLLRPYWTPLAVAFVAIMAESATDLLEPWPLKVFFHYVFGSKPMPEWLAHLIGGTLGLTSKFAVLNFAALAVVLIAAVSAVSTYTEKYLTTSVGQRVMHDLRHTLYNHIQRLSLAFRSEEHTS